MKILIAEDDYVSRLLVKKAVSKAGHETIVTENGKEAWEAYQKEEPNMVISDWMMPEMDGLELCQRIRKFKRLAYTYVILLTSKDSTGDLVAVFEAGQTIISSNPLNRTNSDPELKADIGSPSWRAATMPCRPSLW